MKKIDKYTLEKVLTGLSDDSIRFSDLRKLVLSHKLHKEGEDV